MAGGSPGTTKFLNVDLDLYSKSDLEPLVSALGKNVFVLSSGREGRKFSAHLELSSSPASADAAIRGFVVLMLRLPRAARRLWNEATSRTFNVGIQGGRIPRCYELEIAPRTIREVASLKANLVVTVYGGLQIRRLRLKQQR